MRLADTIPKTAVIIATVASRGLRLAVFIAVVSPAAHAEIFKCSDEFGNVAYLQTPCPTEEVKEPAVADDDDERVVEEPQIEAATELPIELSPPAAQVPSSRQPDEELDACKKRYRDQIDAIDAEIRTAFSPSQGDEYKARLKVLTRQLRACG